MIIAVKKTNLKWGGVTMPHQYTVGSRQWQLAEAGLFGDGFICLPAEGGFI